jgi:hypothetical protein
MKTRYVVLTGMILTVAAQPQIVKEKASMHAKIESQRYCQVDHKRASLLITFSVALKNSAGATITIERPIHVVPLVSRTLHDLQHSKYEFTLYEPDVFFVKPGKRVDEAGTASRQTSVKPGDEFTGETIETVFPIPLTAKFSKFEALEAGSHFVQLFFDSEIQDTATFVRFTSQPVEITVDQHPKVEKCR